MTKEYISHYRSSDNKIQTVSEHLIGTALLSKQFASKIKLDSVGELLGLLHDIGKYNELFYNYISSSVGLISPGEKNYLNPLKWKGKIPHSITGAKYVYDLLNNTNDTILKEFLSVVILSHHGGIKDVISSDGEPIFINQMNKPDEYTRLKETKEKIDKNINDRINNILSSKIINDFKNFIISLYDKNDTAEVIFFKMGLVVRFLSSCLIDADRIDTATFNNIKYNGIRNYINVDWKELENRFETHIKELQLSEKSDINKKRSSISNECYNFGKTNFNGIYTLTVPTGYGKTLASMRCALQMAKKWNIDRIIYVAPYISIIDQNANTIRKILEKTGENVILEHHSNLIHQNDDKQNIKNKILTENWNSPIIFTTMVQFLNSLFDSRTSSIRRMHNLANSIIIIDEPQNLPINIIHMFNVTLNFYKKMCGSTVLSLTATPPPLNDLNNKKKSLMIDKEIISDANMLFNNIKKNIISDLRKKDGWNVDEIFNLSINKLKKYNNLLIITNTKKYTNDLYNCFIENSSIKVFYLTTNMCASHRKKILYEIHEMIKEKKKFVCITTPIIEAGVDIDFDCGIRFLSFFTSILQANGRVNRHMKRKVGELIIININDDDEKLQSIYEGKKKSNRLFDDFKRYPDSFDNNIFGLKSIKLYYKDFWNDNQDEMDFKVKKGKYINRKDTLFSLLSTNGKSINEYVRNNLNKYNNNLRQSFMTAYNLFTVIGTNQRGIIVPYKRGEHIIKELCRTDNIKYKYKLLKEAQSFSINIFSNKFVDYLKDGIICETQSDSGIFYLKDECYDDNIGLNPENNNNNVIIV